MGVGAWATPFASVSTVTLEAPPGKVAPAPLAAGCTVNVTGQLSSTGDAPSIKVARRPPAGSAKRLLPGRSDHRGRRSA